MKLKSPVCYVFRARVGYSTASSVVFFGNGIYNRKHFFFWKLTFHSVWVTLTFLVFHWLFLEVQLPHSSCSLKKKHCFVSWKWGCFPSGFRALLDLMCSSVRQFTCPLSFAVWQKPCLLEEQTAVSLLRKWIVWRWLNSWWAPRL